MNALGGIAAFLGYRHAGRKAGDRLLRRERKAPPTTPATTEPQLPPDPEGSPPSTS